MYCVFFCILYYLIVIVWERYIVVVKWMDYKVIVIRSCFMKLVKIIWLVFVLIVILVVIIEGLGMNI